MSDANELTIIRTALGLYDANKLSNLHDYLTSYADSDLQNADFLISSVYQTVQDSEGDGFCRFCGEETAGQYDKYCGSEHEVAYLAQIDAAARESARTATEVIIWAAENILGDHDLTPKDYLTAVDNRRNMLLAENRRLGDEVLKEAEAVANAINPDYAGAGEGSSAE